MGSLSKLKVGLMSDSQQDSEGRQWNRSGERSLQFPNPPTEDVEEAGGVWAVVDSTPELLENFEGLENVFATETADT
jgi:hypothetical protein